MKKTVTANVSGMVFHIDEDAYDRLSNYLEKVRNKYAKEEGRDEILADIEGRIAEMFQQRLSLARKVVTVDDVAFVISQLGEPEQFETESEPSNQQAKYTYFDSSTDRRFYRDPDDKYIAGVSGGLAAYFNIDALWIRLGFVVTTFVYGFGPFLYVILWIVVPKARTTSERLEMRGKKVNLSNIEMSIKEELNDLKKNIKEFSEETRDYLKKKEKTRQTRNHSAHIAANIIKAFAKVVGVALILATFALLIALISGIFIIPTGLQIAEGIWPVSIQELLMTVLNSTVWVQTTMIALAVVVGMPILWILMAGIQLLFDVHTTSRFIGIFTFVIWLAGIGTLALAAVYGAKNFAVERVHRTEHDLPPFQSPNLYIEVNETLLNEKGISNHNNDLEEWNLMWQDPDNEAMGLPNIRLRSTSENHVRIEVTREARGSSPQQALLIARDIDYEFTQKDSLIVLDPVFFFPRQNGWRDQEVDVEIYIPEGKYAVVDPQLRRALSVHWNNSVKVVEQ